MIPSPLVRASRRYFFITRTVASRKRYGYGDENTTMPDEPQCIRPAIEALVRTKKKP